MKVSQANDAERSSDLGKSTATDPVPQRVRELYTQLAALCAERAELEVKIPEDHAKRERALRVKHESDLTRIEEIYRDEIEEARREDKDRRSHLEAEFDAACRATEKEYKSSRQRIIASASAHEEAMRSQRADTVRGADVVAEATRNQFTRSYKKSLKALRATAQELHQIWAGTLVIPRLLRLGARSINVAPEKQLPDDPEAELTCATGDAHDLLASLTAMRISQVFQPHGLLLCGVGTLVVAGIVGAALGVTAASPDRLGSVVATAMGTLFVALVVLYLVVRSRVAPLLLRLKETIRYANALSEQVTVNVEALRKQREEEVVEKLELETQEADRRLAAELQTSGRTDELRLQQFDAKHADQMRELRQEFEADTADFSSRHRDTIAASTRRRDGALVEIRARYERSTAENTSQFSQAWSALESRWRNGRDDVQRFVSEVHRQVDPLFPAWDESAWADWSPPLAFPSLIRCGQFNVDVSELPGGIVKDDRLAGPWPDRFCVPAALQFPKDWSILLESDKQGRADAVQTLRLLMFRVLSTLPAGKARLTIIDPVGLGQPFAGFLQLANYDEALVTEKIWTEERHIEARLTELTEHMERIIQKHFRDDLDSIATYNQDAGELGEPYRFLVITDFPTQFSQNAARRLASIIKSGPRCGVFPWIHHDVRTAIPEETRVANIDEASTQIVFRDGKCTWKSETLESMDLVLDVEPEETFRRKKLQVIGKAAKEASRVEVPFRVVAPSPQEFWSRDSTRELRVPLGRAGAAKLQYLTLGPGTSQHMLIAGKTGSGKSTLLHVLITNLGMWYSPDEVEFFLIDFKKGVEFRTYASHGLAHAKVVAIESDREYGLSVLRRLDRELGERGDRFRNLGVQDLAGCRQRQKKTPTPRILLIIDEFQELFVDDDGLSQEAALLLDRLVRQGRAFGIHVILGSQTLGGAYSLPRTTMGQMTVRVALQLNDADSQLIMNEDNSAPRLLSRPGEAIYNDQSGLVEGNSPFQVVWLGDEQHDSALDRIAKEGNARGYVRREPQITFEGGQPALIGSNSLLERIIQRPAWPERLGLVRAWIGDAIAIKDPTSVGLRRHSGSNLLIVGQNEQLAVSVLTASVLSLAAQHRPGPPEDRAAGTRFYILDGTTTESPFANYCDLFEDMLPHFVGIVGWRDVSSAMVDLMSELSRRQREDLTDAPAVYTFVLGLQRFRDLRRSEDEFGFSVSDTDGPPAPGAQFLELLREGPAYGIHTSVWCDGLANLNRVIERVTMREFENRILFQMSASDSTNLIETAHASKLGQERALLYCEEAGVEEKFRPYALPDSNWLATFRERLRARTLTGGD